MCSMIIESSHIIVPKSYRLILANITSYLYNYVIDHYEHNFDDIKTVKSYLK